MINQKILAHTFCFTRATLCGQSTWLLDDFIAFPPPLSLSTLFFHYIPLLCLPSQCLFLSVNITFSFLPITQLYFIYYFLTSISLKCLISLLAMLLSQAIYLSFFLLLFNVALNMLMVVHYNIAWRRPASSLAFLTTLILCKFAKGS